MEVGYFRGVSEQDDPWALGSHPWNSSGLFSEFQDGYRSIKDHVLTCRCSRQGKMEGALIFCRVFFLLWRKIFHKTSTSNFYVPLCWKIILQQSFAFQHALWAETMTTFVLDYYYFFFKDVCVVNSLEDRDNVLFQGKGQACVLTIINDLCFLNSGFFSCNLTHWGCSYCAALFLSSCVKWGVWSLMLLWVIQSLSLAQELCVFCQHP